MAGMINLVAARVMARRGVCDGSWCTWRHVQYSGDCVRWFSVQWCLPVSGFLFSDSVISLCLVFGAQFKDSR